MSVKSPCLAACKSAERFIRAEIKVKEQSYLPDPTEAERADMEAAFETLAIVQRAIVIEETNAPKVLSALTHLTAVSECYCDKHHRFSTCYRCAALKVIEEATA